MNEDHFTAIGWFNQWNIVSKGLADRHWDEGNAAKAVLDMQLIGKILSAFEGSLWLALTKLGVDFLMQI